MFDYQLLTFIDAAARLTEAGLRTTPRCIAGWIDKHPDLGIKVAGRRTMPAVALDLILAGMPLADVAARMRASMPELPAASATERRPHHQRRKTHGGGQQRRE